MSFLDKTFCASPGCNNDCGRKMSDAEKEQYMDLVFRGYAHFNLVASAYFCGEPEDEMDGKL